MMLSVLRQRRLVIVTGVLASLAIALIAVALFIGDLMSKGAWVPPGKPGMSGYTVVTAMPDGLERVTSYTTAGYIAYDGPTALEERMVRSDVVARVKLVSAAQVVEEAADWPGDGETSYVNALEYTFTVLEYLKGTGGSELKAVAVDLVDNYATKEEAAAGGDDLLGARETRWDDRDAVVFLEDDEPHLPSSKQANRYLLGFTRDTVGQDYYSIASRHSREWLPAASATASGPSADEASGESGGGEQRFCLARPCDESGLVSSLVRVLSQTPGTPTITLSELKTRLAELDAEIAAGDGSQEYADCVYAKYEKQGQVDYYKQQLADSEGESWVKDGYFYRRYDHALTSGQAAGSHFYTDEGAWIYVEDYGKTIPDKYAGMFQLEGSDAELFSVAYPGEVSLARPLPAGEYRYSFVDMPKKYVVCDGLPEEERKRLEHFVAVKSPEGVTHEAFFDPVAIGNAVGADASNGVLSPADFAIGGKSVSISGLKWEGGQVTLTTSPHDPLTGHLLDFIALDGTVALTLDADAATADSAAGTLTWAVATQPWQDGDLLMLRLRQPVIRTAYFYPTSEAHYKANIVASGCRDVSNFATCLDGTDTDYQKSVLSMLTGSALRLGFAADRAAIPGKITDARFEVVMAAQSGTAAADHYGFDIYSGDTALASVSGTEAVTDQWTEIAVASPALTAALPAVVDSVAFQINGPASKPSLKFTQLRLAVDYDAGAPGQ